MKTTWLNQGGFLFETSAGRLVVDAYLSDAVEQKEALTCLVEPPLTLDELKPDFWLCTHDHLDHFDPPTVEEVTSKFPGCKFIGPQSVQQHLKAIGVSDNRIIPLPTGGRVVVGGVDIVAIPAIHSDPDAIGVMISESNLRVYLSGDTEFPENAQEFAGQLKGVDIMFICINGKWGNMNCREALTMVDLIRPRLAVPIHYGLFAENTVSPDEFLNGCEELGVMAMTFQGGRTYDVEELLK